ncbi:MAG: glycosyltransferase family 4 protein [Flavobacteriaceae bacterium]|nr:glycosyltransferase family 4 protein [Flavobacteriaceae bacterium]
MKDILIITSYFPPETGAASNRIFHLAEGLQKRNFKISVITPLPNYPTGEIFKNYKGKFSQSSVENNIKIYRLWIYASNSKNKVLRLFSMLSYSFSLIWFFTFNRIPKTVIVQSPPLLVAFTSIFFLKHKSRKLILNVSDLWPMAGLELGAFKKNFSYKILEEIEQFNYNKADLVLGQSEEILTHVKSVFPDKETFLYRNYPSFISPKIEAYQPPKEKIKLVYAGLLGIAQGVYKLCEKLGYNNIEFHIYGAGAEKEKIEDFIKTNQHLPITYYGELARNEIHKALLQYDVAIIPLLRRIYGSVPSKIFEYSKLGLPILYFGGGEGEDIVKEYNLGWIAEAGNYDGLNEVLNSIKTTNINSELKEQIRKTANTNFELDIQLEKLAYKL